MDWHGDKTDAVGFNALSSSRLIQAENLATPEARESLTKAIVKTGFGFWIMIGGKGVMEHDPESTETSVTPAWRKTVAHYVGGDSSPVGLDKDQWHEAAISNSKSFDPLR